MTQEEKELLLKDLSARVPYGVMVEQTLFPPSLADKEQRLKSVQANNVVQLYWYKYINEFVPIHCIKPYLRQMSSMTEEEINEYKHLVAFSGNSNGAANFIDWLNKKMFAYRTIDGKDMFELGLALEAPEGMYNIKEQ